MSQAKGRPRRWFVSTCVAGTLVAVLALGLSGPGESGAASVARYKVIGVAGTLEAHVEAGYMGGPCAGRTPSLFGGNIYGRRPGQPAGEQTQYGINYNRLFKASVRSSSGIFRPARGRGGIDAKIKMPYITRGTGERLGCHPYVICEPRNEISVMELTIDLYKIGRRGALLTWSPGGEKRMPRDSRPAPLAAAGLAPIYKCLDTYYPFVLLGKNGQIPCRNKAPKPGTLAKNVFVLHLNCAYERREFHPYTDGDGTRNVSDWASIEADVKIKRVN